MSMLTPALLLWLTTGLVIQASQIKSDVTMIYDANLRGTWKMTSNFTNPGPEVFGATSAQTRALTAKINEIGRVIHDTKVFNPPLGFEARAQARLFPFRAWWIPASECGPNIPSCREVPLIAELAVTLFDLFHYSDEPPSQARTNAEINLDAWFYINDLRISLPMDSFGAGLADARPICLKPMIVKRAAGIPVYALAPGDGLGYLYFTNGRSPWVPVTCEQFITSLIRKLGADLDKQKAEPGQPEGEQHASRAGIEQRRKEIEKMYADLEKDPVKRARLVEEALKAAAAKEAATAKSQAGARQEVPDTDRTLIAPLRDELARMTPAERASAAWYLKPADGRSGLVPAGTPNARELVTLNVDYFDRSRPRSDIQLIVVMYNGQFTPQVLPNSGTAAIRLDEFIQTADWKRIAAFVQPAK